MPCPHLLSCKSIVHPLHCLWLAGPLHSHLIDKRLDQGVWFGQENGNGSYKVLESRNFKRYHAFLLTLLLFLDYNKNKSQIMTVPPAWSLERKDTWGRISAAQCTAADM